MSDSDDDLWSESDDDPMSDSESAAPEPTGPSDDEIVKIIVKAIENNDFETFLSHIRPNLAESVYHQLYGTFLDLPRVLINDEAILRLFLTNLPEGSPVTTYLLRAAISENNETYVRIISKHVDIKNEDVLYKAIDNVTMMTLLIQLGFQDQSTRRKDFLKGAAETLGIAINIRNVGVVELLLNTFNYDEEYLNDQVRYSAIYTNASNADMLAFFLRRGLITRKFIMDPAISFNFESRLQDSIINGDMKKFKLMLDLSFPIPPAMTVQANETFDSVFELDAALRHRILSNDSIKTDKINDFTPAARYETTTGREITILFDLSKYAPVDKAPRLVDAAGNNVDVTTQQGPVTVLHLESSVDLNALLSACIANDADRIDSLQRNRPRMAFRARVLDAGSANLLVSDENRPSPMVPFATMLVQAGAVVKRSMNQRRISSRMHELILYENIKASKRGEELNIRFFDGEEVQIPFLAWAPSDSTDTKDIQMGMNAYRAEKLDRSEFDLILLDEDEIPLPAAGAHDMGYRSFPAPFSMFENAQTSDREHTTFNTISAPEFIQLALREAPLELLVSYAALDVAINLNQIASGHAVPQLDGIHSLRLRDATLNKH